MPEEGRNVWVCITVKNGLYCAAGSAVLPISLLLLKNMACSVSFCLYMGLSERGWNIWFELIGSEVYRYMGPFL